MKNLYILPTRGLSLLHFAKEKMFITSEHKTGENDFYNSIPQYVYIVADDNILVHDFVYDTYRNQVLPVLDGENMQFFNLTPSRYKKIVITNDTDLLREGVKEVTRSLLEWIATNSRTYDFVRLQGIFTKGEHSTDYTVMEPKIKNQTGNIHLIPTIKATRLYNSFNILKLKSNYDVNPRNLNAYITKSDEDIHENDFIITKDGRMVQVTYLLSSDLEGASKVVLTSDQDLIKQKVQAIPDEFLEWLVKNPTCEEIEVAKVKIINYSFPRDVYNKYKIIIPSEELSTKLHIGEVVDVSYPQAFRKQETLEEAAEKTASESFAKTFTKFPDGGKLSKETIIGLLVLFFKLGAKWQQERSYSEEEVIQLVSDWNDYRMSEDTKSKVTFKKWFEQFKKK